MFADGGPTDRRSNPAPTTTDELLRQLPARALLDRMPAPAIGLGHDGVLVYANAAAASMLGYADVATLLAQGLPSLLAGHSHSSPLACVTLLRDAGDAVIDWSHADGFPVHATVSSLLLRSTDPILVLHLNDVTDLLWADAPRRRRA